MLAWLVPACSSAHLAFRAVSILSTALHAAPPREHHTSLPTEICKQLCSQVSPSGNPSHPHWSHWHSSYVYRKFQVTKDALLMSCETSKGTSLQVSDIRHSTLCTTACRRDGQQVHADGRIASCVVHCCSCSAQLSDHSCQLPIVPFIPNCQGRPESFVPLHSVPDCNCLLWVTVGSPCGRPHHTLPKI